MNTPAYITGSYAYGDPREDSDIDLVVLLPLFGILQLAGHADPRESLGEPGSGADDDLSLRFGKLNLICFADPRKYHAWREATEELVKKQADAFLHDPFSASPVTREEAVALIDKKIAEWREK